MSMVLNCKCDLCGVQFGVDMTGIFSQKLEDSLFGNNKKGYVVINHDIAVLHACDDHTAGLARFVSLKKAPTVGEEK